MSKPPEHFSVKRILSESTYSIPIYQRNYAWEAPEVTQMILDIRDSMNAGSNVYYIGTLVVNEHKINDRIEYEVVDGQQRLTTLFLIASFLNNEKHIEAADTSSLWLNKPNIEFKSRGTSQKTCKAILNNKHHLLSDDNQNSAILHAYKLISEFLPSKNEVHNLTDFTSYFLNNVILTRVEVPDGTDLNHYFEIMNNRGEQLEKHEILKTRLMDALGTVENAEQHRNCLHQVWEACANMEKYALLGFSKELRKKIHNKPARLSVERFDELSHILADAKKHTNPESMKLSQIIEQTEVIESSQQTKITDDRVKSIIDFPNFLLQVLSVMLKKPISLDDKRLLATFNEHILKKEDCLELVKEFVFSLLKCRFLFDNYLVRNESLPGKPLWLLECATLTDDGTINYRNTFSDVHTNDSEDRNKQILMLLSAFAVSSPVKSYMHWLNGCLKFLFYEKELNAYNYLQYLEGLARAFIFDRFLAKSDPADYSEIIYKYTVRHKTTHTESLGDEIKPKLRYSQINNNFIFNFLDYLLWVEHHKLDNSVQNFQFSYRSSVEHHYPQVPKNDIKLDDVYLHSFGNLCLLNTSKNSRLNNNSPVAKKDYYIKGSIDSLKQYFMFKEETWDKNTIRNHENEMIEILTDSLKPMNGCSQTNQAA